MTERAENTAQPEPSGGSGPRFESGHSDRVATAAATPAATDLAKESWDFIVDAMMEVDGLVGTGSSKLDESDWQWADEQAALLGLTTEPFPECEHYEFPPGENSQEFWVMWTA